MKLYYLLSVTELHAWTTIDVSKLSDLEESARTEKTLDKDLNFEQPNNQGLSQNNLYTKLY